MSDDTTTPGTGTTAPAGMLTPEASAIVGFTLAVTSLLGQTSWTTAMQSFFGTSFPQGSFANVLLWYGVASLVMAVVAMWFGRRVTFGQVGTTTTWAGHLARADIVLAAFGALFAVLTILGAVISRG